MNNDGFEENAMMEKKERDKKYWERVCTMFWIYFSAVGGIIGGIVVLSIGLSHRNSLKKMDADLDFTVTQQTCPIIASTWIREDQKRADKGRPDGCNDIYVYEFSVEHLPNEDSFYAGRDSYSFKSFEHAIARDCQACSKCDRKLPRFVVGEEPECWRPSVADVDSVEGSLSKWYRCGNDDCIKVLPPQEDEDRARKITGHEILAGSIVLPVSVLGLLIAHFTMRRCCFKNSADQGGVITGSYPPVTKPDTTSNETSPNPNNTYQFGSSYDPDKGTTNNTGTGPSLFDQMNTRV